jgi:hypothetical protein
VLEGGVNGSLNLDGHGKSLSFLVLSLPIRVPEDWRPDDRVNATAAPGSETA